VTDQGDRRSYRRDGQTYLDRKIDMVHIRLLIDNVAGRVESEARVNLETSGPSNLLLRQT